MDFNLVQAKRQKVTLGPSGPAEFFGKLMQIRDIAHLTHLRQPDLKYSTHKALNTLYDEVLDLVDTLIESWQGIHGLVDVVIPESRYRDDPATWVQELYSYIASNRTLFSESWVQNQLDEVATLLAQTLYRLKYVQ